ASTRGPRASPTLTTVDVSSASTRDASIMIILAEHAELHSAPSWPDSTNRHNAFAVITTCRGVCLRGPDADLQSVVGKTLSNPLAPLHNRDGLGNSGVQIKIVQFRGGREPVSIDMHQGGSANPRGMDA